MNNARILVVEDEAVVAMEVKERLIAMGHQVAGTAQSGEKALQCIREQRPSLVLMDIRLKGDTDGITTAETIRREFCLPVIFLTAHSDDETLERAKLAEPYGYILKPINEHELKSTIEISLYKHRTDRQILRLNRLYDVLSQVNQAIVYNRSRKDLLQAVCRILVERGEVDLAWFDWLDPDALRLSTEAFFRESDHVTAETEVSPNRDFKGGEQVWKGLSEGKPVILGTCAGSKCPFSVACTPALPELESCGHFPVKLRGRVCGVLSFRSREIEFSEKREIELFKEIACDLSFALERMDDEARREQAETAVRASEARFKLLSESAWRLLEADDPLKIVAELAAQVMEKLDCHVFFNFMTDEGAGRLRLNACAGISDEQARNLQWLDYGAAVRGRVARDGVATVVENICTSQDLRTELVKSFGVQVYACHPLMIGAKAAGTLSFGSKTRSLFSPAELDLMKTFTHQLATAVERTRAEELLRKSEEHFRNIFEQAAVGMSILSPSGAWLQVNQRLCDILGYSRDELMKLSFRDLTHPEHLDADVEHVRQMVAGVRSADFWEKRYIRKDGEVIWALITTSLIRSEDGEPQYFITVTEEITGQVRQREQILLLNRLYSVLSQVSQTVVRATLPEPFLAESCRIVTEEGGLLLAWIGYVDKETNRVIPMAFSGEAGEYAHGISVYADDRPEGRGPTGRSIRDGRPFVYNDFLHDELAKPWRERAVGFGIKSAAAFPILSGVSVWGALTVYSDQVDFFSETETRLLEKVAGEIGFALDHMESKRQREKAAEALDALRRQNELILSSIGEGILGLDSEGRHTFVNPCASSLLGYEAHELIGKTGHDLYHRSREDGQPYPLEECPISQTFKNGILCPITEEVFWRKDGTSLPVRYSSAPIIDGGEIHGAVVTFCDITQRRKLEEERAGLQAQLAQAQKMEALGTLAGGIAHDFNNILGAILGYAELAQGSAPEGSEQSSDLEQVLQAGYRARDLVSHILTFSRQGPSQELRPISIAPIIKETLKLLRASLPASIEIRTNISDQAGMVTGDPTQMHQVLMNLCTNAAHAMRPKGGLLEIGLTSLDLDAETANTYEELKEGEYVNLTVKDTGHGMDPATLERIFDPYFTTKGVGEGTGLGLAVVHGIVKRHGGAVKVLSRPGAGATFEVLLPRNETVHETAAIAQSEIPQGTERILLVDDEETLAELGRRLLRQLGYQVTAATKSVEALELFRSQPDDFDLVIANQTMPGMTGADLAVEVRRIRRDLPIILCTGFSESIDEKKALEMGIRAFIMKPIDRRDMAEAIRKVLDER